MNAPDTRTPSWIHVARTYLGTAEIPGPQHSAVIGAWLHRLKAWWRDDEAPWCGVFTAAVMQECGLSYPKAWYRARAWLEWGQEVKPPAIGCIAVFERGGGGHVGFVVGKDDIGRLLILGGNQGNAVSIAPFYPYRLLGCRWPPEPRVAFEFTGELPLLAHTGPASRNET